jgi:acetyltransferase EpsM
MAKESIIIWGTSGFARKVVDIINLTGKFEIKGFIDDREDVEKGTHCCGYKILGGQEELPELFENGIVNIIFAFGNCHAKLKFSEMVKKIGFKLPTIIHPMSSVSKYSILGDGTIVGAGCVIENDCTLGEGVLVNTRSSIGHNTVVGAWSHIGPGATVCGRTNIGNTSWIGAGATLIDGSVIGADSFIGAGSLIVNEIPGKVLAYGSPAKVIRQSDGEF